MAWTGFLEQLAQQYRVSLWPAPLPAQPGWFDRVQLEQVLINLLKNAHEAGGAAGAVELALGQRGSDLAHRSA